VNPELNGIINANWGFSINETKRLWLLLLKQRLKKNIKSVLPRFANKQHAYPEIMTTVKEFLANDQSEQLFFKKKIEIKDMTQEELFHLLTLLRVSEKIVAN
jgi:hypothetical protein